MICAVCLLITSFFFHFKINHVYCVFWSGFAKLFYCSLLFCTLNDDFVDIVMMTFCMLNDDIVDIVMTIFCMLNDDIVDNAMTIFCMLNDDIVDIVKPDGICSPVLMMNFQEFFYVRINLFLSNIQDLHI